MNPENYSPEHEELAIDSVEGMAALLEVAREAVLDIDEAIANVSDAEIGRAAKARADAAFLSLQAHIEKHSKVLDLGGFLTEDDTDEIQALYNDIASVEDELDAEINKEQIVTREEAVADTDVDQEDDTIDNEPAIDEDSENDEEIAAPDSSYEEENESLEIKNHSGQLSVVHESESDTDVKIHETTIDTETVRIQLKKIKLKSDTLIHKGELLREQYKSHLGEQPASEENNNSVFLFQQLEASLSNTKEIQNDISTCMASTINEDTELFLLHAGNELNEFEENLLSFEKGLEWLIPREDGGANSSSMLPAEAVEVAEQQSPEPLPQNTSLHKEGIFSKKNELRPYIDAVVADEHYKRFLSATFNSPGAFEAYLRREIYLQEEPSQLDKVFGIIHASPFDTFLRDMTIRDIEIFDNQTSEKIREALTDRDIQYETFVLWMKAFAVMKQLVSASPSMTFGELFVRAMANELLERAEEKI